MRLSTDGARDDARSADVLAAALDAGVDLLDTADAYGLDDADLGHNELLIARAISSRRVAVVTKGGLTRPGGAWRPDGRARHLEVAARESRDRLGIDAIDLYLLHAIDPAVELATSVRALARLRDAGVTRAIGLSNVNLHQLEQALAITAIEAVEVELSPYRRAAIDGGLVRACERRGIRLLAHRPLGGPAGVRRLAGDPVIGAIAASCGATPGELALAWLRAQSPVIVPLPGATRVETARSAARAAALALEPAALAELTARFTGEPDAPARAPSGQPGEVVVIVGMPAAGKTTLAIDYAARGYLRLNRDERGGSLADLARELRRALAAGVTRVVLDNTYPSRASRAPVIAAARRHGIATRCVVLATPLEQAQANAVARMLEEHGRLLEPAELGRAGAIGPSAQFRYRRAFEPPSADEGFGAVDEVAFAPRAASPGAVVRAALIVELDGLVWRGRPRAVGDVALAPGAAERLAAWSAAGYVVTATAWQPAPFDPAIDVRLCDLLGQPISVARCTHPAGPPACWCRKPLPGLALWLARRHRFALAPSVHVGRGAADRGFALRAGVRYLDGGAGIPPPP